VYRLRQTAVAAVVLVALAGFAGCDSTTSNFLQGSVTLEGKPVTGNLTLISANGKEIQAAIGPDGNYYVPDPPIGQAKFTIKPVPGGAVFTPGAVNKDTEKFKTGLEAKDKAMAMPVSPPAKYGSADSSGLSFDIKAGKNKFDMPLTP